MSIGLNTFSAVSLFDNLTIIATFSKSLAVNDSEWNLITGLNWIFFFMWCCDQTRVMASSFLRFLDHTQRRTTVGRIPLDEWSARRRDFCLTTHNTDNKQTSMPLVGFEPTFPAGERPQTHALERAATGAGTKNRHDDEIKRCDISDACSMQYSWETSIENWEGNNSRGTTWA